MEILGVEAAASRNENGVPFKENSLSARFITEGAVLIKMGDLDAINQVNPAFAEFKADGVGESSRGIKLSSTCKTLTLEPKRLYMLANSSPI
jgi:hypothetical protein